MPSELAEDLTSSYEEILIEYRKGHWQGTLWKAGKFAENVFRILEFLLSGNVEKEAPSFRTLKEKLERASSEKLPESIRILIPRITSSLVYDPRSKRATVHVKEINPDYLDANLVVSACSWILAEFVKLYHTSNPEKIGLINELVQRKVPFIEKHKDKVFVTKPIDCRSEILLLLLNSPDGIGRREIGTILGGYYTQGRITQSLQELEKERQILKTNDEYVISGVGETQINKVLSQLV
jgi:ribosome-binding factor A